MKFQGLIINPCSVSPNSASSSLPAVYISWLEHYTYKPRPGSNPRGIFFEFLGYEYMKARIWIYECMGSTTQPWHYNSNNLSNPIPFNRQNDQRQKSQRWGNKVPNKEASSRFNLPLALKILTTADINYVKYLWSQKPFAT